jgi:peptidoglycan/xylan/chitin deacetylase (PgdA/CDA1 family)
MYHAVANDLTEREWSYSTPTAEFERQMAYLAQRGYRVVTLRELCSYWKDGKAIPPRMVALTFDDGYDCLHRTVMPVLKRFGFSATLFMVSDYIGRMGDFDVAHGIPARQMLSRQQLLELLREGIEIGSHTATHADLPSLDARALRDEVQGSKATLEDVLGVEVCSFAYPKGRFNSVVRDAIVHAGYAAACSTRAGINSALTDRYVLRRAQFGANMTDRDFAWKIRIGHTPIALAREVASRRVRAVRAWFGGAAPRAMPVAAPGADLPSPPGR